MSRQGRNVLLEFSANMLPFLFLCMHRLGYESCIPPPTSSLVSPWELPKGPGALSTAALQEYYM